MKCVSIAWMVVSLSVVAAEPLRADVSNLSSPYLPAAGGQYVGHGEQNFLFGGVFGFAMGDGVARDFVITSPPTADGNDMVVTANMNFFGLGGGEAFGAGSLAGGVALGGSVTMRTYGNAVNPVGTFATEITQMDLSGTGLGVPVLVRQSTYAGQQSLGQLTVTSDGGGQYSLSSSFDIYFELCLPSLFGNQWENPINSALHFVLGPETGTQADPLIPVLQADGSYRFTDFPGTGWYDPPMASGYVYETTDPNVKFTILGLPEGLGLGGSDGQYTIIDEVNGTMVAQGGTYITFQTPVNKFTVTGIDPPVDSANLQAFPTFLAFSNNLGNVDFTMTPVPEPSGLLLLAAAMAALGACRRSRGRTRTNGTKGDRRAY